MESKISNQTSSANETTSDFDPKDLKEAVTSEMDSPIPKDETIENVINKDEDADDSESEEELDIDEEELANLNKDLSEEDLLKRKKDAADLKNAGNECYKAGNHKEAFTLYSRALNLCPLQYKNDRSVLYANRAAVRISMDKKDDALLDCNKAIELNPDYVRVVLRRAQLHRKMDNLERCLEDYKKILELDKNNLEARQACATLPAEINERNEKLKAEMFGKLKELGNICLKPFGLSTDNFKMVQDPNSGGYSINFQK